MCEDHVLLVRFLSGRILLQNVSPSYALSVHVVAAAAVSGLSQVVSLPPPPPNPSSLRSLLFTNIRLPALGVAVLHLPHDLDSSDSLGN